MRLLYKILTVVGAAGIATLAILFVIKAAQKKGPGGLGEKVGKSLDERLQESKDALDKATGHFQEIADHIKNLGPQ